MTDRRTQENEDEQGAPPSPSGGREPVLNLSGTVVALILICAAIHLVRLNLLDPDQDWALLLRAAFIPYRYTGGFAVDLYAFTSPLTYAFLHGSLLHLGINMIWLVAFGSPLANRLGPLRFLLFWAITSMAAAGLYFVIHMGGQAPLVGASGAISGMMAAAARFCFAVDHSGRRPAFAGPVRPVAEVLRSRGLVAFLAVWMVVNLVVGLYGMPGAAEQIAWEAHIGGFAVGFFGVGWFVPRAARAQPQDEIF